MTRKAYLIVYTKGGHEFHVFGESVEDVQANVIHRHGWAAFTLLNGKPVQVYSSEIVAVAEGDGL